jgi:hypothetical protein
MRLPSLDEADQRFLVFPSTVLEDLADVPLARQVLEMKVSAEIDGHCNVDLGI